MQSFSAKEGGAPLSVHMLEAFEVAAAPDSDGLLPVKLQACHTGVNRNQSFISGETMQNCAASFKGRPILGAIHQTDTGEYEFHSHDMMNVEDDDGNETVEYIEQPIGAISDSKDPYLEHDDANDKDYLVVEGNIFEDYTKAAEILQRHQSCPCSVEILINDMSWNVEDDVLVINDFSFRGVTILGYEQDGVTPIQEGMQGSNIKIQTNSEKKGGEMKMSVFEQLLKQYDVQAEDLNFEYAELSDEELTEKFKAQFEAVPVEENESSDEATSVEDEGSAEDEGADGDGDSGEDTTFNRTFSIEISHEDTRSALYNLLAPIEAENDDYFYIRNVYDSYFVVESWVTNKLYKWGYSVEDAVVSLNGEPEEVFEIVVNAAEKAALELMRSEYADLKAFKQQYDEAQLTAQKDEVFNEYAFLEGNEAFDKLKENAKDYSVDEIKTQVKVIHSDTICAGQTFEFAAGAHTHGKSVGILNKRSVDVPAEYKPYGSIFDED
ncbi:MAG: hypothetical protein LUB59_03720 [Candidatus Gastranaerophilales bacterium]|nr:hypothetical protein [Candidatus Gastranaerophilales bacterium]